MAIAYYIHFEKREKQKVLEENSKNPGDDMQCSEEKILAQNTSERQDSFSSPVREDESGKKGKIPYSNPTSIKSVTKDQLQDMQMEEVNRKGVAHLKKPERVAASPEALQS